MSSSTSLHRAGCEVRRITALTSSRRTADCTSGHFSMLSSQNVALRAARVAQFGASLAVSGSVQLLAKCA
eukprot:2756654-Alexandrium_andersonii.AAC.1